MISKEETVKDAIKLLSELVSNGYTKYRIAKETDIAEKTIGNYVNKINRPSFRNAKVLLDYYSNTQINNEGRNTIGRDNNAIVGNSGVVGNIGGHQVTVSGSDYEKIIDKDKIEIIRSEANKMCLQEVASLKAEISRLEAIIKSKDQTIAAKDETIEVLKSKK